MIACDTVHQTQAREINEDTYAFWIQFWKKLSWGQYQLKSLLEVVGVVLNTSSQTPNPKCPLIYRLFCFCLPRFSFLSLLNFFDIYT